MLVAGIIGVAVVGGGGFWGGMTYAQSARSARAAQFTEGGGFAGRGGRGAGAKGSAFGQIIAKDATSITVQLMGGPNASSTNGTATGSKIVLYDASTQIDKFTTGAASDLAIGDNVTVGGTPNSDGSITAHMIQIRPAGMGFGGQGARSSGQAPANSGN